MEAASYGLVQQHCRYGRIHSAAKAENHLVVAELGLKVLYGCFNEGFRGPVSLAEAHSLYEVSEHDASVLCMEYLRMILEGVYIL